MATSNLGLGPDAFTNYNGQQVLGPNDGWFMDTLNAGANAWNKAMGTNLTAQQFDQMSNPTTYGARWGGASTPAAAPAPAAPQTAQAASPMPTYGISSSPFQGAQADAIRNQQQQFIGQALNGINSGAVAVGGLGGSRQGVAQGVAIGQAATGLDSSLANLYGSNWNQDQNRALTQYGMDQNFYTAQRGQDQAGMALGANLYGLGQQGQWNPYSNFASTMNPFTGFGTTTGSTNQGGRALGALGGALGGAQLYNLWSK